MKARAITMTMKILRKVSITLFDRLGPTSHVQMDLGSPGRERASFIMLPGMPAVGNSRSRTISERTFTYRVATARSCERKPILETPGQGTPGARFAFYCRTLGFSYIPRPTEPRPRDPNRRRGSSLGYARRRRGFNETCKNGLEF